MRNKKYNLGWLLLVVVLLAMNVYAETRSIDLSNAGVSISPYIRGQSQRTLPILHKQVGVPAKSMEVAHNTSLRGVGGGLIDETYNWKDPTGQGYGWEGIVSEPVLEYLRLARDTNSLPFITVNTRGIGSPWGTQGAFNFLNTDSAFLVSLASDYVRYTNRIVSTYRQGQSITDSRDNSIVNSIRWNYGKYSWQPLLGVTEAATLPVKYWEIGNEPDVGVAVAGFTLSTTEYGARYKLITTAMKAEDSTIKVGPCMTTTPAGSLGEAYLVSVVSEPTAIVDFVSYHPYDSATSIEDHQAGAAVLESGLRNIYNYQLTCRNDINTVLNRYGRTGVPLVASEYNPGNPWINGNTYRNSMAQMLGCVETVFSHARLGLFAAHFWQWPCDDRWAGEIPMFQAYKMLQDNMGNALIDTYTDGANFRLYTTKNTASGKVAIFGLNFSDSTSKNMQLNLQNIGFVPFRATFWKLVKSDNSDLSLLTQGDQWAQGGDVSIKWVATDLTGSDFSQLQLAFDDATICVLVLEPRPQDCASAQKMGIGFEGDINNDCYVNINDFAGLATKWLQEY